MASEQETHSAAELRERAARYRTHARVITDCVVQAEVETLADELEAEAEELETRKPSPTPE
jgi:hypothetical protein